METITTIGLDIAKSVFQVHGVDAQGKVISPPSVEAPLRFGILPKTAIEPVTDMPIKYRLPAASTTRAFADIGDLMSFGAGGP
jgi:hypothetical protein